MFRETIEGFEPIVCDHATVFDFHAILGPSVAKPSETSYFDRETHIFHYFYRWDTVAHGRAGSGNSGSRIAGTEADRMPDRTEEMPTRLGPLGLSSPPAREVSHFHPFSCYVIGGDARFHTLRQGIEAVASDFVNVFLELGGLVSYQIRPVETGPVTLEADAIDI